jgi:hypothetical protein
MPIVAHEAEPGVNCCVYIVAAVEGRNVELRGNECGVVVGVIHCAACSDWTCEDQVHRAEKPEVR